MRGLYTALLIVCSIGTLWYLHLHLHSYLRLPQRPFQESTMPVHYHFPRPEHMRFFVFEIYACRSKGR